MVLPRSSLKAWITRLARRPAEARQELPGITPDRTFQIFAGAVALHQAMKALDLDELEVSQFALREGVPLRYIESLGWHGARRLPSPAGRGVARPGWTRGR